MRRFGSNKLNTVKQSKKGLLLLLDTYRHTIDKNVIAYITDKKGTIIYANKKFRESSQYSDCELIGHSNKITNSKYHPKEFFKTMWKTIGKGNIWHHNVKNKAKDGTFYWLDTVILPLRNNNHKIIQYLTLQMLITKQKEAEEIRNENLKCLEEMLFMISHKVRQPIATFLGLMQLIDSDKLLSKEEQNKILKYAKSTALQLDIFTKELTSFICKVKATNIKKNEPLS